MLANRLPDYLTTRLADLQLPPLAGGVPSGGANAILDPTLLAKLPPAVVGAIRFALSDTLHDIYLFAGGILFLALIATFFMREVPLTGARRELGFEAAPVELDEEERERAVARA